MNLIDTVIDCCKEEIASVAAIGLPDYLEDCIKDDVRALRYGALTPLIARKAGMGLQSVRRELHKLEQEGLVASRATAGGCTRWWVAGLASQLQNHYAQNIGAAA